MGSNANRHFDKGGSEWGRRPRKVEAREKKHAIHDAAIEDSAIDGAPMHGGKRRRKDTKRWCRGKVGKEHDWQPFDKWPGLGHSRWLRAWTMRRCQVCGKENLTRA